MGTSTECGTRIAAFFVSKTGRRRLNTRRHFASVIRHSRNSQPRRWAFARPPTRPPSDQTGFLLIGALKSSNRFFSSSQFSRICSSYQLHIIVRSLLVRELFTARGGLSNELARSPDAMG